MKSSLQYRLLFLGVEWERKGGAMVLDIYRLLVQSGVNPHLYIIGCTPPVDLSADENIVIIPYLDKNRQEDFIRLHTILLQTDLLLLPTRAECAGVVFCEAAAYGIPSITTDTGGVGTYILNGFNGYALPYNATAEEYVEKIISICNNPDIMDQMKTKSRQRFEEVLNWETWGNSFESIVKKICTDEWRKQAYTSKP
jgi:glycosyltransferase involved in cell wall biosynthesis